MATKAKMSLSDAFAQAMTAYESGKATEARRLARALVEDNPNFGGAHYLLGLLALDQGQVRRAVDHLARAIAITPGQPILHQTMGRALELGQNWPEAARHYRLILEIDPDHAEAHRLLAHALYNIDNHTDALHHAWRATQLNPASAEAWHFTGMLLLEKGQPAEAVPVLRRAVEIRPDWAAALNNFGLALRDAGQLAQAHIILQGVAELRPDHAASMTNLASVLRLMGRLDEARHHADRAVRISPRLVDGWMELGLTRQALGLHDAAAAAFDRATALAPRMVSAWYSLAEVRRALGDREKAAKAYEKCLQLDPQDRHGAALGLALAGMGVLPEKAPAAYVRQLFDDYADRFDDALTEKLDYCAPDLLDRAIAHVAPKAADWDILDVGCGTGLAAAMLRPRARRLQGIDLSPAMLDKARHRNLYDALDEAELVSFMAACHQQFDLICAADVLVYVGDLEPVYRVAHDALRPDGLFAFTVERSDDCSTYSLGAKQRYSHHASYLRRLAEQNGFHILTLDAAVTRRDSGLDVPGYVVVMRKDAVL